MLALLSPDCSTVMIKSISEQQALLVSSKLNTLLNEHLLSHSSDSSLTSANILHLVSTNTSLLVIIVNRGAIKTHGYHESNHTSTSITTSSITTTEEEFAGSHRRGALTDDEFLIFDDDICGCGLIISYVALSGYRSRIEDVVIHPSLRGKGLGKSYYYSLLDFTIIHHSVGKRLMEILIKFGIDLKCQDIQLTSNPKRVAARQLYDRMGFQMKETSSYVLKLER